MQVITHQLFSERLVLGRQVIRAHTQSVTEQDKQTRSYQSLYQRLEITHTQAELYTALSGPECIRGHTDGQVMMRQLHRGEGVGGSDVPAGSG